MNDLSGTQLGPYDLREVIGRGGMSTVYRAYQPSMERDVAVKVISPDLASDPEFMARFEREAQIIASLQHPHILPVYDFGRANGLAYLVMRLMVGGSLAKELRGGALAVPRILDLGQQIASALDYAHRRGIVHRDLKPTNILLDESRSAYLTDFGIAKLLAGGTSAGLTLTGVVMGTPTYMAPEQWRTEPVDGRTDIYAFGVILYQMLIGRVPFSAETPHGLMYQHLDVRPPSLHALKPELPLSVEPVISKALAKQREDRYASASDLVADLERALLSPARLPEQTDFEANQRLAGVRPTAPTETVDDLDEAIAEDEMLAQASADEAVTLPPTGPQPPRARYNPPPAQTIQAPRSAATPAPPPPPPYQPPTYQPQRPAPPPAEPQPLYAPQPPRAGTAYDYEQPARAALGRWLWVLAAVFVGIVVLGVFVLLASSLLSSGDGDSATPGGGLPTLPATAPPSPTALYRPSAVITSPANGTAVSLGDPVTIAFTASDTQQITRVELRRFDQMIDSVIVNNQPNFEGTFAYTPDSTGTHTLEVVPFNGDIRGDAATVTLYVQ